MRFASKGLIFFIKHFWKISMKTHWHLLTKVKYFSRKFDNEVCFQKFDIFKEFDSEVCLQKRDNFQLNSTIGFVSKSLIFFIKIRHWGVLSKLQSFPQNLTLRVAYKSKIILIEIHNKVCLQKFIIFHQYST